MYGRAVTKPTTPEPPPKKSLATDPVVYSLVRWALIIAFVVVGWMVLAQLAHVLAPILAALGIAYLLDPIVEKMVARGMSRGAAAGLILVAFLGTIAGLLALLIPEAITQVEAFIKGMPAMLHDADRWIQTHSDYQLDMERLNPDALKKALEDSVGPPEHIAAVALGGAFQVLGVLAELLLVPVFAVYFLVDWPHIEDRIIKVVPPRKRTRVKDLLSEIDGVVSGWVRGQAIVTSLLAVLYALAFWIIGVPLGVPIGFLVGALTIIPFIGTFVGAAITMLVLLLDWQGGVVIGATAVTFLALHLLEAAVLTPKIVGHKVGLSESAALFAVVAGGKLLGFVGILLAVPIAATVAVFIRHGFRYYARSEFFGDEADAIVPVTPGMALMMPDEHAAGAAPVGEHTDDDAGEAERKS